MVAVVVSGQEHAPQPGAAERGTLGPGAAGTATAGAGSPAGSWLGSWAPQKRLVLERSRPVLLAIPAIGVESHLGEVGLAANGTIQVPPLYVRPSEAAWYRYSPTPGEIGPSVIIGHVDDVDGPAVFFRLGALVRGDRIDVRLSDGVLAVFAVDGVRRYAKAHFPTDAVYGPTDVPSLRLVTCGGAFDGATRHYVDNVVVFASLVAARRPA